MEASPSLSAPIFALPNSKGPRQPFVSTRPTPSFVLREKTNDPIRNGTAPTRITAIDVSASAASTQPEITWQIAVGAIAGVLPFVVAAIEFSKRIVAQRKCEVCGGSGLVQREEYYFRCPGCGPVSERTSCCAVHFKCKMESNFRVDFCHGNHGNVSSWVKNLLKDQ